MTKKRCTWCEGHLLYEKYHDEEWGVPVYDDHILFEFLILESFQAGLSWLTILNKRENFRKAFDYFDVNLIALYTEAKVEELKINKGIVRHELKIRAAISNAKVFLKIQKEFGSFSDYLWDFVDHKPVKHCGNKEIPATTPLSDRISKDLKKRGFKFMGSTIVYAYLKAVGVVNDHQADCFKYEAM